MCRNSLFCLKNLCRAESFAACPAVVSSRGFRLDANSSPPRSWNLIHGCSSNGCSVKPVCRRALWEGFMVEIVSVEKTRAVFSAFEVGEARLETCAAKSA